jgi:hypothetical protein
MYLAKTSSLATSQLQPGFVQSSCIIRFCPSRPRLLPSGLVRDDLKDLTYNAQFNFCFSSKTISVFHFEPRFDSRPASPPTGAPPINRFSRNSLSAARAGARYLRKPNSQRSAGARRRPTFFTASFVSRRTPFCDARGIRGADKEAETFGCGNVFFRKSFGRLPAPFPRSQRALFQKRVPLSVQDEFSVKETEVQLAPAFAGTVSALIEREGEIRYSPKNVKRLARESCRKFWAKGRGPTNDTNLNE